MSNGLESRLVESTIIDAVDWSVTVGGTYQLAPNMTYKADSTFDGIDKDTLFKYNGTATSGAWGPLGVDTFYTTAGMTRVTITSTPQNNQITLDNSDSPAYKHLMTIGKDSDGMAHLQVFSQEMISNGTAYDGDDNEFSQLTNGTTTDDLARTITTKVSSIPLNTYFGDE